MNRKEEFNKKRERLEEVCVKWRKNSKNFPPTAERCNSCRTGNRLRWLQTEYVDVTGWSHTPYGKKGGILYPTFYRVLTKNTWQFKVIVIKIVK